MSNRTCSVDGCGNPVKRFGYCYGHYMKNWRYGTPTPEHKPRQGDLVGRRYGTLTVAAYEGGGDWRCECDCGGVRVCQAGALNRTGNAATCGDRAVHSRAESAGYTAAHRRMDSDYGKAKTHACVDCGGAAKDWSYDHEDTDELLAYGLSVNPIAYSLKPEHYQPRCKSCHTKFDNGHVNSASNVAPLGRQGA